MRSLFRSLARSLSLPLSFLHIEFFHHPRVPSTASVAYVPKITCCLFCLLLLLFSMLQLQHVGSEHGRRETTNCLQLFTGCFFVALMPKYQQSMKQSNKSKWQHNFSLENAYKNM